MAESLATPASKVKLLPIDSEGSYDTSQLADDIYDSFRSYKKDRCAIFVEDDQIESFMKSPSLDADILDPGTNFHWTGVNRTLNRKWKHILVGDYIDWFCWFMKWQRFNAFHVLVLIRPIGYMMPNESRGYLDGFLTRLVNKQAPHAILIVEERRFEPVVTKWLSDVSTIESLELVSKFGPQEFKQAILATLYGTTLSHPELVEAASRTISSKLNPNWQSILQRMDNGQLIARKHRWFRSLGEDEMKMVEHLSAIVNEPDRDLRDSARLFQLTRKREHIGIDKSWLEDQLLSLVEKDGWFTLPQLYDHVRTRVQEIVNSSDMPPGFLDSHLADSASPTPMLLPSETRLRGVTERMVSEARLSKSTWFREVGRPTIVYHPPGRVPFDENNRCGQCAFYISQRRRCRLWWLLDQSLGYRNPRWSNEGTNPLPSFEIHKMKNSWRISPHSSACSKFVDKKRDYARKGVPESCDICGEVLPKSALVACTNCRTRYVRVRQRIRVLTSYEHEFERTYRELAGSDPASDMLRLQQERRGSTFEILERIEYEEHRPDSHPKTLLLFPGDRMIVKDGTLSFFKRRNVESVPLAGAVIINHDVMDEDQRKSLEAAGAIVRPAPKSAEHSTTKAAQTSYEIGPDIERTVREYPEFIRKLVLAMARSAIHATKRVGSVAALTKDQVEDFTRVQSRFLRRLEHVAPNRFLVYEALAMKQYWNCYDLALKRAMEWFGPRKKSRFVREYITNPTGRAKGYTAVDAAINYLHQRRLFKSRSINRELGLRWNPGEGFLHRKHWNSKEIGLLLDLIDPFKFADREELLKAVLDKRLNWRDFYGATDRRGVRFYHPKPDAVSVLESIGEEADRMQVEYAAAQLTLVEAYQKTVSALVQSLKGDAPLSFEPFVFSIATENLT